MFPITECKYGKVASWIIKQSLRHRHMTDRFKIQINRLEKSNNQIKAIIIEI